MGVHLPPNVRVHLPGRVRCGVHQGWCEHHRAAIYPGSLPGDSSTGAEPAARRGQAAPASVYIVARKYINDDITTLFSIVDSPVGRSAVLARNCIMPLLVRTTTVFA